ncbi:hypothetical protein BC835DRAFT_1060888 [Cytidiella melzeri]|nr:hypothetical protein BC835DRAFT_1060888 [Cytidiella melzeri]
MRTKFIVLLTHMKAANTLNMRNFQTTTMTSPEEDQLLDVDENDDPDSELVTAGLDEGDDDQDEEPEHDVEPIVVPADEVLLTQETEYSEDGGTDHGTNAEFEHPENLYDYDDPLEGQDYADLNAYEAVNWDALEDPEAFDAEQAAQDDASSKQSSDTLSTLSKRSREEEDDDDESTLEGASLDSPHLKRIRTR